MINYKGVIFDLDGTILDSLKVWEKVDKAFFKKHNLNMPINYQNTIKSMTLLESALYTKKICGIEDSQEEIIECWKDIAYNEYKKNVNLKPGVLEYIFYLKENKIKIGIATMCDNKLYEVCLKKHKIYDFFDTIVDSSIVKRGKDYPDIYEVCAKRLGIEHKDIVVFEDIMEGIISAKQIGMQAYYVYDKNSLDNVEEVIKQCDEYITDFRELIV